MSDVLDSKIENVLDSAERMFIATSVGGNSSGASVFFSRDGLKAKKELKVFKLMENVTK